MVPGAGRSPLRLRRRLLRALQSHRLFFPHRHGRSTSGAVALEEEQAQWGKLRREKKNEDALFKNPGPTRYMGLLPSDRPVGPGDLIKSRNSRARDTWRKRWRGNRGVPALSSPTTAASSAPRASQNSNRAKSVENRTICQTEDFLHINTRSLATKVHSTKPRMDQGD